MQLENKVALVTGAGQGIGRGIALKLANSGARVIVTDLSEENAKRVAEEIVEMGGQAVGLKCDVSQIDEVKAMFNAVEEQFGKIDILVNNAGIFPFVGFEQMTKEDWGKVMAVNLDSLYSCSHEGVKIMSDGGRIINISSIASIVGFNGLVHYCTSKSAMNGFTRALALELASRQITVNAVAPGAIATPGANSTGNDDALAKTIAAIPLARQGQPEDIAGAVNFLASDDANYITGQVIVVDGGYILR
ncbi:MAG TPA: SDR family oxidoreductase [Candidatus Moranbacteria bacterium]|nr:SDR family oxidoreductase [Candidatus Moranbacteria bacterium]